MGANCASACSAAGSAASISAGVMARLSPARPMASSVPNRANIDGVGAFRKSAQFSPAKASTSSASVEPVKSSP